ncbi:hypothetical protein LAV75_09765, partial [Shigella flexneri]|uniref:hypothetical protein n=1 Tax=Shigella flexneri TaxID=623 RepID=UPI0023E43502
DGNGSHASTLKSPSYTKSVSWQHYQNTDIKNRHDSRFFYFFRPRLGGSGQKLNSPHLASEL